MHPFHLFKRFYASIFILQAMLDRLQKVQPMYRVSDCVDSWRKNAELTEMITAYPESSRLKNKVEIQRIYIKIIIFL